MDIQQYLEREIPCGCGRIHQTALKRAEISGGAIEKLPGLVRKLGHSRVFVISDANTWPVLGKKAETVLKDAGIPCGGVVLPGDVLADEEGVGRVLLHFDRDSDLILAVGTGTVNDIGKLVSYRLRLPYFIVATAPSMDGFVSNVAAMTADRMKTTYPAHVPEAVIADLDVLSQAPMAMIAAGLGDILGKYTALCDWRISHIINGEYECPEIAGMMEEAIRQAADSADGLLARDPEAVSGLMEALILSGIAMSFALISRPASGSEHHISHFWEMRFLAEGRRPVLHGTKVGVGTILSLGLYQRLLAQSVDFQWAREHAASFDKKAWEAAVRKGFGPAAEGVLELEKTARKNDAALHGERIRRIQEHWPELTEVMQRLPDADRVRSLLQKMGAAVSPADLGIDGELTREAILLAKEVRDRYTVLQLLWDLGLLERYAAELAE